MSALFASWLLACTAGAPAPDAPIGTDSGADRDSGFVDSGFVDSGPVDSAPVDSAAAFCDGVPVVAYTNFGEGFLRENCQGCHASTAPDRHDAPASVVFDTVEDAWALAARILARSTGESPTMPPQGGVSADDRVRLQWWLECGTPGT